MPESIKIIDLNRIELGNPISEAIHNQFGPISRHLLLFQNALIS